MKKRTKVCLSILMIGLSVAANAKCNVKFTQAQETVMRDAYAYGKQYDYGYSMAAISWQESSAGNNLIGGIQNADIRGDFRWLAVGTFHNLIRTVLKRESCYDSICTGQIMQKLIVDFDYAASQAVKELDYWKSQYGENWGKIWTSYFAGWDIHGNEHYGKSISRKIKYLRRCVNLHE